MSDVVKNKERIVWIDFLRIAACFLVIVNHTNSGIFLSNGISITWFASLTYFFISKIAVPIFVMITGYTLLDREDTYKKTLVRLIRIVLAWILFSFLYYLINLAISGVINQINVKSFLISIWKQPITNAFWYLYLYMGILLMLPFLQKFVRALSKRDLIIYIVVSVVITGVCPIIIHYIPILQWSEKFDFSFFSGWIALLFTGYYLKVYTSENKKKGLAIWGFVLALSFNIILTFLEYRRLDGYNYMFLDNRLYLPIIVQSICVFYLAMQLNFKNKKVGKIIEYMGGLTFGIYLLSDKILALTYTTYQEYSTYIHPLVVVICWELFIFVCGGIITSILRKVPGIKKLL